VPAEGGREVLDVGESEDAVFVRTMFAQPDVDSVGHHLREVEARLERSLPKAAAVIAHAEDDVTAYATSLATNGAKCGP
jgi:hypothetical protein